MRRPAPRALPGHSLYLHLSVRRRTILVLVLMLGLGHVLALPASGRTAGSGVPAEDAVIDSFPSSVSAQSTDATTASAPVEAPIGFTLVGFDVPAGETIRFRVSQDGETWGDWEPASEMDEGPDGELVADGDGRVPTSPAWVGEARWLQVEAQDPARVRAHVIDSSGDAHALPADVAPEVPVEAAAARPAIVSRASWGADESISSPSSKASTVRHAVIHHTASSNDYASADVPAIVRGFHRYHAQTQGWSDIGYNFLIDKYGRIYEGRNGGVESAVIGAHARGFNTASVGVALIGNFDTGTPTQAALLALRQLLAWKLGLHGVDPTSTVSLTSGGSPQYPSGTTVTLPAINGHRDTGYTSCPGATLYPLIAGIAKGVKAEMGHRSAPVPAPIAPPPGDPVKQCLPEGDPGVGPVWRAAGPDRIATAITASRWYWRSSEVAIIANAYDFPDALAAAALAAEQNAPLLLTDRSGLHATVASRLQEMGAKRVYVMGGDAALSSRVDSDLARLGLAVTRVAGSNRWATAADAARRSGAPAGEATLALGTHVDLTRAWPDAVAAGALAATPQRMPTLLTAPDALPAATAQALRDLNVRTVWVLGDVTAVSARVEQAVADLGITVRRLAGRTRYGTSVAAAAEARRRHGSTPTLLVFASGANFPDALAGAAVAARRKAPLLLVPPCGLEQAPEITEYLRAAQASYADGVILGSTAAISERIRWQVGTEFAR